MYNYRIKFCKTGESVFISHLDLMRTFQRAFFRAELALGFSEGFNPHARMTVLLPLPLGDSSLCEYLDFEISDPPAPEEMISRLNTALPDGIRVSGAYPEPERKRQIKWLRFSGRLNFEGSDSAERIVAALNTLFASESLSVMKKTKHGEAEIDLKANIRNISFSASAENAGCVELDCTLSAAEPALGPAVILNAIARYLPGLTLKYSDFCRISVFDADFIEFP